MAIWNSGSRQAVRRPSLPFLASGDVGDIEVIRSLDTQYGLDDQAIEAVRQWKFEPGRKDGKVVPVQVTIEMAFALR